MSEELRRRVEMLEIQNKRMRMALMALCLCFGALLTMGQTLSKKAERNTDRMEVREIVLSDGSSMAKLTPNSLVFSGGSGRDAEKTIVEVTGISLSGRYATELKRTGLVCSREGVPRFDLSIGEIGAAAAFKNASGSTGTMVDETTMVLMNNAGILSMRPEHLFLQKGEADAFLTSTSLRISDTEKNKAILGQSDAIDSKSGNRRARSAASLVLSGKDDALLWQAP